MSFDEYEVIKIGEDVPFRMRFFLYAAEYAVKFSRWCQRRALSGSFVVDIKSAAARVAEERAWAETVEKLGNIRLEQIKHALTDPEIVEAMARGYNSPKKKIEEVLAIISANGTPSGDGHYWGVPTGQKGNDYDEVDGDD